MKRRVAFTRLAAAIVCVDGAGRARAALAQRPARIGAIHWESADATYRMVELRDGLLPLGYVEGRNIEILWRWAGTSRARARQAAEELEAAGVSLIYAHSTPTVHAVKEAARRTPVVITAADVLATGIVGNLTRPGGLITGVTTIGPELAPKRLQILKDVLPRLRRVGFLASSVDPNGETFVRETLAAGASVGVEVIPERVRGVEEFPDALERMRAAGAEAVILQTLFLGVARRFIDAAMGHRIPCVGDQPGFVDAGALLAFGADRAALNLRIGVYIDRILKGAAPGDLPIEQPSKFRLVVNRKAARALGLTVPPSVLELADEVVE